MICLRHRDATALERELAGLRRVLMLGPELLEPLLDLLLELVVEDLPVGHHGALLSSVHHAGRWIRDNAVKELVSVVRLCACLDGLAFVQSRGSRCRAGEAQLRA